MKIQLVSMPVKDPAYAHETYVCKLGFVSKEFDAETGVAVVVSPEEEGGTALLLEPCSGTFAEDYQKAVFDANLPIMIFSVADVEGEMNRLSYAGVKIRPDLDRPDWGLTNLFEDGCGNLLMIQQNST